MELGPRPVTREQLEADPENGRETGAALKRHQTHEAWATGQLKAGRRGRGKGMGMMGRRLPCGMRNPTLEPTKQR